jgi:hypothetical protein
MLHLKVLLRLFPDITIMIIHEKIPFSKTKRDFYKIVIFTSRELLQQI